MVPVAVILFFAAAITIDYLRRQKRAKAHAAELHYENIQGLVGATMYDGANKEEKKEEKK
ncbi:MAG TPA: hypothetical protein VHO28_01185 [Ignavibacteriales bacterium]|jgi:hypothetical protein|nr:hypothetical protein [Ignavibacteriales bacterium]HEX3074840.1 hypothetical protein [Ignavibacteriales bacterium]